MTFVVIVNPNPNIGTIIQERPKVATYGEKISTTLARELEIS